MESTPEAAGKNKPAQVQEQHEEHKEEEDEWQLKGSDSTSTWHRVMKVTKKTSSKVEQCTKTYKVVGGKKILIEPPKDKKESEEVSPNPKLEEEEKLQIDDKVEDNVEDHDEDQSKVLNDEVSNKKKRGGVSSCCPSCNKCLIL